MDSFFCKNDPLFLSELSERLQLQRSCLDKHLFAPPVITVGAVLFKPGDTPIFDKVFFSRSYVRNFYNWLVSQLGGACSNIGGTAYGDGTLVMRDTGGTNRSHSTYLTCCTTQANFIGPSGINTRGILVGRGTTSESFNQYSLATLITNGTGANQLLYGAQAAPTIDWDSLTRLLTIIHTRTFENGGVDDVSVTETGHGVSLAYPTSANYTFIRDLLPEAILVETGLFLRITYNFSITYPA